MKKQVLLFAFLVSSITQVKAQTSLYHPFPDSNAVWNIHYSLFCLGSGTGDEYYSITISGDTSINNLTYHKLAIPYVQSFSTGSCGGIVTGYQGATREDTINRKVFFVPSSDSTEQLLYDFTMQVGDTVRGYLEASAFHKDIVKSIDSVVVGSTYRKRWSINSCYNIFLIEGVGSTYGLIAPSSGCITDQADYAITCFRQDGKTLYPDSVSGCDIIDAVNNIRTKEDVIQLSPNPSGNYLGLHYSSVNKTGTVMLSIINVLGQTMQEEKLRWSNETTIDIEHLPPGLYFIKIIGDNPKSVAKFVKE